MSNDLLTIEDDKKRKLYYRFTPAAFISNFVPLIVILDDKNRDEPMHFEHKMWNVLTPIYHSESEKGDDFVKDLLQKLIQEIADEYECEDHIYIYGSDTSSYGAILHGILCNANAVYAHAPDISPQETHDLTHFLNPTERFPIFYLGDVVADKTRLENETAHFIDSCKKHHMKVHLKISSNSKGDERDILIEVLDFFERVASER